MGIKKATTRKATNKRTTKKASLKRDLIAARSLANGNAKVKRQKTVPGTWPAVVRAVEFAKKAGLTYP